MPNSTVSQEELDFFSTESPTPVAFLRKFNYQSRKGLSRWCSALNSVIAKNTDPRISAYLSSSPQFVLDQEKVMKRVFAADLLRDLVNKALSKKTGYAVWRRIDDILLQNSTSDDAELHKTVDTMDKVIQILRHAITMSASTPLNFQVNCEAITFDKIAEDCVKGHKRVSLLFSFIDYLHEISQIQFSGLEIHIGRHSIQQIGSGLSVQSENGKRVDYSKECEFPESESVLSEHDNEDGENTVIDLLNHTNKEDGAKQFYKDLPRLYMILQHSPQQQMEDLM
ncbi:hypothetical protein BC937DRAFT_90055 [Endogone sp. FLAS-F59071]|nr:hypothetical protein BC937DRAFT_90055 [Endogone sp. FLAS-F59071]|eukprot:RUS17380.1 hypothetical protein BC937DRAFT_90055 [Endogone sp. FLAS-F59071]